MRGWKNGALIAAALLAGRPAWAQCPAAVQARTPAQVAERLDFYWREPRNPATWRALAGLGHPDVDPQDRGGYLGNLQVEDSDRPLLRQMLPDQRGTDAQYWYPDPGGCRLDYALKVARERVARLGRDHPYVAHWMRAQRIVFSACRDRSPWEDGEGRPPAPRVSLPPALATGDPAVARLQREDRAYQQASILFYRRDPADARAFRAIAASSSAHAPIARYMLAAIAARDVDADAYNEAPQARADRVARAHRALADARAILADPTLAEVHPLAQGLIGFLGYWTGDDRVRDAQVDSTLAALQAPLQRIASDRIAAERYGRAAFDIVWLRRDLPDEGVDPQSDAPIASSAVRALARRARRDPFAAWLIARVSPFERTPWASPAIRYVEQPSPPAAVEPQAGAGSDRAWSVLAAGFGYEAGDWASIDRQVREAEACPSDDRLAALVTVFYHQVRTALMYPSRAPNADPGPEDSFAQSLARVQTWPWPNSEHHRQLVTDMLHYLGAKGRLDEARTLRDRVDPRPADEAWRNSAVLLLLAEDEDHFVREVAAMPDAQQPLINLLSIETLARLAQREDLPSPVRARFARVAWARLYALQRRVPRRLDRLMRALNPEISSGWTSRPGARPGSPALLLDVLRSPALNIVIAGHQRGGSENMGYADDPGLTAIDTFEHSDNNWWCAWQVDRHRLTASAILYGAFFRPWDDWDPMAAAGATAALGPLLRGSWLWRAQDESEQEALSRIPSAPQLLAERAVAWRGRAPGQDEALALAVRATRYGCQRQGGHGAWSRAAHAMLHARFPNSEAARRTRWWFDCSHFTGGCGRRQEDLDAGWERWAQERWYY